MVTVLLRKCDGDGATLSIALREARQLAARRREPYRAEAIIMMRACHYLRRCSRRLFIDEDTIMSAIWRLVDSADGNGVNMLSCRFSHRGASRAYLLAWAWPGYER